MKFNTEVNKDSITRVLNENRQYSVPVAVIVISFFLLLFFILPQILAFPQNKREADLENEKLNKIEQALEVAKTGDSQTFDTQIATALTTFPQTKNFEKILSTISSAASLSNTFILRYEFFDTDAPQNFGEQRIPFLNFKIEILGGPRDAAFFIDQLYIANPISEATSIKTDEGVTEIDVIFYYKPFESLSVDEKIEIKNLSSEQLAMLNHVSGWNNPPLFLIEEFDIPSTSSGTRTSPF